MSGDGALVREQRVLVVDDEGAIREIFRFILESEIPGVIVDEAVDGLAALESIELHRPQVIVLDLHMPRMDGLSAFTELQSRCRSRNVKMPHVVFCTGFAPPDAVMQIIKEGNGHVLLSKPVRMDRLVSTVRSRLTE